MFQDTGTNYFCQFLKHSVCFSTWEDKKTQSGKLNQGHVHLFSLQVYLTHLLGSSAELNFCDFCQEERVRFFSLNVKQLVNGLLPMDMHKGDAVPSDYLWV